MKIYAVALVSALLPLKLFASENFHLRKGSPHVVFSPFRASPLLGYDETGF